MDQPELHSEADKVIREGQAADRLLSDPVFQRAALAVEERIKDEWAAAEALQERERAHFKIQALKDILIELRAAADRAEVERMVREGATKMFGAV